MSSKFDCDCEKSAAKIIRGDLRYPLQGLKAPSSVWVPAMAVDCRLRIILRFKHQ